MSAVQELEEAFGWLQQCCLHEPQWRPSEVSHDPVWIGDQNMWSDGETLVVVKLDNGWGLFSQWSDYTGHGCRCNSMTVREDNLRDLLGHLTDRELERVILRDPYA